MTRIDARVSLASFGFGVSGTSPRAPAVMRSTTARGYAPSPASPPKRRRMSSASRKVVASGTVGPDPMTLGSSPTTSEMANVRQAPGAAAASHPPLLAERCFLTVFSSWMSAPARRRCRVVFCLSASVRPSAGTAISAEAPPDSRTSSVSSEPSEAATCSARRPACSLPAVGIGWPPTIISNGAANCAPASATLTTRPARMRSRNNP